MDSRLAPFSKIYDISECVTISQDGNLLLDNQPDARHVCIAMLLLYIYMSLTYFFRSKCIFFKDYINSRSTLVNTTPCLDFVLTRLSNFSLDLLRSFVNHKYLLILHVLTCMITVYNTFDVVLHLSRSLLPVVMR